MNIKRSIVQIVPMDVRKRYWLLKARRRYQKNVSLRPSQYRQALADWYHRMTGKTLDLDHPKTFGEKIQYLKLYDSTFEKGRLADKYGVRSYVDDKLGPGHTAPLLGVWDQFDDIPFDTLPESYVLKATLGSGTNIFVTPEQPLDRTAARKKIDTWLSTHYEFFNGFELQYGLTKNRIIAEKYMDFGMLGPIDYRFFCSYGHIFAIMVDTGSPTHDYRRTVFDPDWNVLDVTATHPRHDVPPEKPALAVAMARDAQILSKDFSLMRVDLYAYHDCVIVGELTFTPESGLTVFDPESYGLEFGRHVTLPREKKPYKGVIL